jgi:peptide/nickel transport system substrate-binding protein
MLNLIHWEPVEGSSSRGRSNTSSLRKLSAAAILTVLVAAGFVGVTKASSTSPTSFVYVSFGEPSYLDPAISYEYFEGNPLQNIYETLIWYDGSSANDLVPMLALEVPTLANGLISPDGLSYTFRIAPGVVFHDGTALTADDVVYSIQRVLRIHDLNSPSWVLEQVMTDYVSGYVGATVAEFTASSYYPPWMAAILDPLGQDYVITEDDVQAVSEAAIVKVDDMMVTFRLTHPYGGFLSIVASLVCSIVSKDYVEAHGGIVNGQFNEQMLTNTCGSGPYELVAWEMGSSMSLKRFDGYHGALPSIVDVQIINSFDMAAAIQMLRNGDADAIYLPPEYESEVAGDPAISIVKGLPTFDMDFIGFNTVIDTTQAAMFGSTVPSDFFMDKNVRNAFVHLMNSELFITNYLRGNAIVPNGPIPAGLFGYDATAPVYDYSVTMAKELLENATNPQTGNSWWEDGFNIAFIFNAGNLLRETACWYLKGSLESLNDMPGAHGVFQATINALDWPTYLTLMRMSPSPLPIFFLGWTPDYADPDNYVNSFLHSAGWFPPRTGYSNASIDENITLAAAELNGDARLAYYKNIVSLCYDDAPYIWLDQRCNFRVMGSWVTGYYFNPMHFGFYYASLDKVGVGGIEIVKSAGSPGKSAAVWTIDPIASGNWSLLIENDGLTKLTIDVVDMTTGGQVAKLVVSLSSKKDTSTGTFSSEPVPVMAGHTYSITVTPHGKAGTSAMVYSQFTTG